MRYVKSFLAGFVFAVAAFAGSPSASGTANSSIVIIDPDGDIVEVIIGLSTQGVDYV